MNGQDYDTARAIQEIEKATAILARTLNELQLPDTMPGFGLVHLAEQAAAALRRRAEPVHFDGFFGQLAPWHLAEHAADLAEKEFRSLPPVDSHGNGAEDAELAFRTMAFMRDLASVLKAGGR